MSLDNSRSSANNRSLEDSRSSVPNSSRDNSISPSKRIHNSTRDNSRSSLPNSSRDNSISPSKRILVHNWSPLNPRIGFTNKSTSISSLDREGRESELTDLWSNSALNLDSSTEYLSEDNSISPSKRIHNRSLASSFETSRTSFNSAQLNLDSSTEYISDASAVVSERGHRYYVPRATVKIPYPAVRTEYDLLFKVRE